VGTKVVVPEGGVTWLAKPTSSSISETFTSQLECRLGGSLNAATVTVVSH